jgi:hypothetical protein
MRNDIRTSICRAVSVAVVAAACLPGCVEDEPTITIEEPQVDPRFASADALVEYFNELTTTEPANLRRVSELYYGENELQQRNVEHNSNFVGVLELHQALYDRFGRGYFPDHGPAFEPNGPATITERSPQRATATYPDSLGRPEPLQLVQVGDRWWISGYTLENHPMYNNNENLPNVERNFRVLASVGPQIISRTNRGEFRSADEALRTMWELIRREDPGLYREALESSG